MKAELRNDKTLIVTAESTAELVALQKFENAKVSLEKPQPFQMNVDILKVERQ